MWHKAEWMGRPMRLELTRVGLLVKLANRYTTRGAHLADIYSFSVFKPKSQAFDFFHKMEKLKRKLSIWKSSLKNDVNMFSFIYYPYSW